MGPGECIYISFISRMFENCAPLPCNLPQTIIKNHHHAHQYPKNPLPTLTPKISTIRNAPFPLTIMQPCHPLRVSIIFALLFRWRGSPTWPSQTTMGWNLPPSRGDRKCQIFVRSSSINLPHTLRSHSLPPPCDLSFPSLNHQFLFLFPNKSNPSLFSRLLVVCFFVILFPIGRRAALYYQFTTIVTVTRCRQKKEQKIII